MRQNRYSAYNLLEATHIKLYKSKNIQFTFLVLLITDQRIASSMLKFG